MTDLEAQFHQAMVDVYVSAKRDCRYNASIFWNMVLDRDGLATAQHLLATDKPSDGFTQIYLCGRLDLARDLLETERDVPPEEDEDRGKAALTELFDEARNEDTPIAVERIVRDIDEIVRLVRFDGWQNTTAGAREVKKALRKTLFKYQLHCDTELFAKAYGYIEQYY